MPTAADHVYLVNKYTDKILEIIYSQEEYTTSDLQGIIGAIVLSILNER